MGLTNQDCKLLVYGKEKLDISYDRVLTLGRQHLYLDEEYFENFLAKIPSKEKAPDLKKITKSEYAESFFEFLGCEKLDCLDFSDYEGANIVHDLNKELPETHFNKYDVLIDAGTLEHVFHFPTAIQGCMNALKVGGHFIGMTVTNNFMGHGFYQFSPELFFRIFSVENGFKIKKMLLRIGDSFYSVKDPKDVMSRVELVNSTHTYLIIVAEKIESTVFQTPQQIDYVNTWNSASSSEKNELKKDDETSMLYKMYQKIVPKKIKYILRNIRYIFFTKTEFSNELGTYNINHFEKDELF